VHSNTLLKNEFVSSSLEVKYNCKSDGTAKIALTVSSENCDPFTVHWSKVCSSSISIYKYLY
jgi:hypothetical protein